MRDPHDIRHGDTWEVRNGRAVVVASNDWPSPAPMQWYSTGIVPQNNATPSRENRNTSHDQETGTQP